MNYILFSILEFQFCLWHLLVLSSMFIAFVKLPSSDYSGVWFFIIGLGIIGYMMFDKIKELGLVESIFGACIVYFVGAIVTSFIYWIYLIFCIKKSIKESFKKYSSDGIPNEYVNTLFLGEYLSLSGLTSSYEHLYEMIFERSIQIFEKWVDSATYLNMKEYARKNRSISVISKYHKIKDICNDPNFFDSDVSKAMYINELQSEFFLQTLEENKKHYPPKFKDYKSDVVNKCIMWPITLIWLMTSRLFDDIIRRIVEMFGKSYDLIGKILFKI